MDWKFATTLIGSVPFTNSKEAVNGIVAGAVSCPAWPQLTQRGYQESMYVQTGIHLPGLKIEGDKAVVDLNDYDPTEVYNAILSDDVDYFVYPTSVYSGFYEMLEHDVSAFTAVKGQVTGPISEGLQILDKEGRPVIYDEAYCEIVRKTVNMSAKWQARRLSMKNDNVIIFFDEPSASMLGTPFASISDDDALKYLNESLDGVDCFRGLHCCGNTNWGMLLKANIDILSIDAYQYGENLAMYPEELSEFLRKGGSIAWGIVPNTDATVRSETAWSLAEKLEGIFDKIEGKGIDRKRLAKHSLLTPQCGLSGLSQENFTKALALLRDTSLEMKKRYEFQ